MEPEVAREFEIRKGHDAGLACDTDVNGDAIADKIDNYTPDSQYGAGRQPQRLR